MTEKFNFGELRNNTKFNRNSAGVQEIFEDGWDVYDSSLNAIGGSFFKTLPSEYTNNLNIKENKDIENYGKIFKNYIEETLKKNRERVAVEFGGPGSKFFSGFNKDFFKKTVGVCLNDIRFPEKKEVDNKINHSVVIGDILDSKNKELFDKIFEKLDNKKIDFIISRMMGPLEIIKMSPILLEHIIRKWFSLLSNNGVLFAQFEYFLEHDSNINKKYQSEINPPKIAESEIYIKKWAEVIQNMYPNEIEIGLGRGVIRITKKDGAPDELPQAKELFGN